MALPKLNWNDPKVAEFDAFARDGKDDVSIELIDAIYDDDLDWTEESKRLCALRDSGGSLEIVAYRRMVLKPEMFEDIEDIQCTLEERYAIGPENGAKWTCFDPDGLAEVKTAYDAFVSAFIKHYKVWACEPVAVIVVPVKELYDEADDTTREEFFGERND